MPIVAATQSSIDDAAEIIREGGLVGFATETVYGLGADATNGQAVAAIFAAKDRPSFNPLIVHVPDLKDAEALGEFSQVARRLAEAFWPGPLTLVVKRKPNCPIADLASAGLDTLALRVPNHPVALNLLRAARTPIAAPSANRSGHVSPTLARHVDEDLGLRVRVILDAGPTEHGIESTVLDVTGQTPVVLRSGAVSIEQIAYVLGYPVSSATSCEGTPSSPGQMASHYAPKARLRLDACDAVEGEALLAFGPAAPSQGFVINLSPACHLHEAAAHLFAALRAFDSAGAAKVAVMPIPNNGLGVAINDRLRRAAAPRS